MLSLKQNLCYEILDGRYSKTVFEILPFKRSGGYGEGIEIEGNVKEILARLSAYGEKANEVKELAVLSGEVDTAAGAKKIEEALKKFIALESLELKLKIGAGTPLLQNLLRCTSSMKMLNTLKLDLQ